MPIRRLFPLAFAVAVIGAAPPATADCDPAGPVERVLPKADVAFVGSVTATDGPVARFAVAEVWAGHVPDAVEVRGITDRVPGQRGGAIIGEDDRLWIVGQTYLVVPTVDGGVLRDHICTATTEWSAELESLRPANARVVAAEEDSGATVPTELIIVGAVVLVVAGASVLAFRRR